MKDRLVAKSDGGKNAGFASAAGAGAGTIREAFFQVVTRSVSPFYTSLNDLEKPVSQLFTVLKGINQWYRLNA